MLNAVKEVEDGMVAFLRSREQERILAETEASARRSLAIGNVGYREGITDFQRVLDAQNSLLRAQQQVVAARSTTVSSAIGTYRALGGGWEIRSGQGFVDEARIDPVRYELAVASAEAQLALTRQNLKVGSSTVEAAAATLDAAKAGLVKDTQNEARLKRIDADVPGAISQRSLEWATTSRIEGEAQVASAKANLQKAIEGLGPRDEKNPQLLAARAALDKAKLDLQYTRLIAPSDGIVTDLRVDVGNFAATGQPLMTFVAAQKMWVEANLTENNLGHVKPGDAVDLVLDIWPDKTLRGRVRNITFGVTAAESTSKPGTLPTVQNARDWLRNAQRFPVLIDFEDSAEATQLGACVGSQVNVLVYTGDHPILNPLGRFPMWLSALLSYAY